MSGSSASEDANLTEMETEPLADDERASDSVWYQRMKPIDALVIALLGWWATGLTWGAGGHDPVVLSVTCALSIPALAILKPWKQLPTLTVALVAAVAVAVWIVVLTAPTGINGANTAPTYVASAATLLIVASWAKSERRVWIVVGIVLLACFFEFSQTFWVWLGGADSSTPLVGTIYYLNSFGAFMIPGVLLGMAVVICDIKALRILGLVVGPLSIVAVVYSTSKGSQIALVLGALALGVIAVVAYRWRGLLRALTIWILGVILCFLVTGPPFFNATDARLLPGGSTALRTGSTEGAVNGVLIRIEWAINSLEIVKQWPLTGGGFHSVAAASTAVGDPIPSAFVHNGFLQALAEGGLVLGIPFLAGCVAIGFVSLKRIWRTLRNRGGALEACIAVTILALMLHSGMDFDWSYPSLMMGSATLAALIIPKRSEHAKQMNSYLGWTLIALVAVSLAVSTFAAWHGNADWNFPV